MMSLSPMARLAAGLVALVPLAGLIIQFSVSQELQGSAQAALWAMFRFFTVIANTLTMLVLLGAALGLRALARPSRLGGVTLLMALVGIVYVTVLRHTEHLTGNAQIANILMHYATPALVALLWLVVLPKGGLTRIDPLNWALLPLAYFFYAIVRAHLDGKYPYPFMNVATLGWPQVAFNVAVIALGFLIAGLAVVWLDRKMAGARAATP